MSKKKLTRVLIIFISSLIFLRMVFFAYENISIWIINLNELKLNLSPLNKNLENVISDEKNYIFFKIEVFDKNGEAISNVSISPKIDSGSGQIEIEKDKTDKYGECLFKYIPPNLNQIQIDNPDVSISCFVNKTLYSNKIKFKLAPPPIVLIHGYQANQSVLVYLKENLIHRGFNVSTFQYDSSKGVINASKELYKFLNNLTIEYALKGIYVKRYDLIAHSMGGLVSRYYSTSEDYMSSNNIRKILFLGVPHKGSPWAPLGYNYIQDQGILDLLPNGDFLTKKLHSNFNYGLNPNIEVANLLSINDEVVDIPSSALDYWGVKTNFFNIGENKASIDKLLKGNILDAPNHNDILFNEKVFDSIHLLLNQKLTFPLKK